MASPGNQHCANYIGTLFRAGYKGGQGAPLLRLYLEIRDICCPGAGLVGTRDSMAQIRDIPGNPGRVATLVALWASGDDTRNFIYRLLHCDIY